MFGPAILKKLRFKKHQKPRFKIGGTGKLYLKRHFYTQITFSHHMFFRVSITKIPSNNCLMTNYQLVESQLLLDPATSRSKLQWHVEHEASFSLSGQSFIFSQHIQPRSLQYPKFPSLILSLSLSLTHTHTHTHTHNLQTKPTVTTSKYWSVD